MDLAQFDLAADAERGATIQLRNPRTGEPLTTEGGPVEVSVKGADGMSYRRAYRDAEAEIARRPLDAGMAGPEEIDERAAAVLAAVTIGWRNIVVEGQAWEFTPDAAASLYRRFVWIKDQVEAVVLDRRRFGQQAA